MMNSFAPIGLLFSFVSIIIPIVLTVFVLLWIYRIKTNSDIQVEQNEKMINMLEELKRKNGD